jgi:hypothetical protein
MITHIPMVRQTRYNLEQTEIPSYILKKIKFHVYEVFKDHANTPGEIDPETILGKCQVCINAVHMKFNFF